MQSHHMLANLLQIRTAMLLAESSSSTSKEATKATLGKLLPTLRLMTTNSIAPRLLLGCLLGHSLSVWSLGSSWNL
jgi:hypothetical protein